MKETCPFPKTSIVVMLPWWGSGPQDTTFALQENNFANRLLMFCYWYILFYQTSVLEQAAVISFYVLTEFPAYCVSLIRCSCRSLSARLLCGLKLSNSIYEMLVLTSLTLLIQCILIASFSWLIMNEFIPNLAVSVISRAEGWTFMLTCLRKPLLFMLLSWQIVVDTRSKWNSSFGTQGLPCIMQ